MKAVILLATLKKEGLSNTRTLSEFLAEILEKEKVTCEIIQLVNYHILPGTYLDMGEGDQWPEIFEKIVAADIIIFATPIWWGGHCSQLQQVIERLDQVHDHILEGKKSELEGKVGGIVITGDSDGAQHIIGNVANFFNAIGIVLPPFATLSVLWDGQRKEAPTKRDQLWEKYQKEYLESAQTMAKQLIAFAKPH